MKSPTARTLLDGGIRALAQVLMMAAAAAASAATPGSGHIAELRGIRIYYEIHGRGPALILLHGGLGDGRQFSRQIPAFESRYRLIVPDARAQGRSSDGPGPLTYHDMAEDVLALMDRLRIGSARVMGWSDGGIVGLDLAIHHPSRVSHLITFGANFSPDGLNAADRAWGDTATAAAFGEDARRDYRRLAPDPDHFDAAMNRILAMWRTQPDFSAADLGRVRARTLIVAGEHDVVRREHSEQLAKAIPNARLWIVPGANHSVMVEKPEVVNPVALEFLSR